MPELVKIEFLGDLDGKVYAMTVFEDEYTTGGKCYVARHPELYGCKAQGDTIREAMTNLEIARADYIWALQSIGEPIPAPNSHRSITL